MKKDRVDILSIIALELLESGGSGIVCNNTVTREFTGYISSFAQTIAQSGASRSVHSYADTGADTAQKRYLIVDLLYEVLKKSGIIAPDTFNSLQSFVDRPGAAASETKAVLIDAAEACKKALRTFKRT